MTKSCAPATPHLLSSPLSSSDSSSLIGSSASLIDIRDIWLVPRTVLDAHISIAGEDFLADEVLAILDDIARGHMVRIGGAHRLRQALEKIQVTHRWGSFNWVMNPMGPAFKKYRAELRAALEQARPYPLVQAEARI